MILLLVRLRGLDRGGAREGKFLKVGMTEILRSEGSNLLDILTFSGSYMAIMDFPEILK